MYVYRAKISKANSKWTNHNVSSIWRTPVLQILWYVTADVAEEKGLHLKKLSGTKFRQMLRGGEDIPEWFAFKSVVSVLRENM